MEEPEPLVQEVQAEPQIMGLEPSPQEVQAEPRMMEETEPLPQEADEEQARQQKRQDSFVKNLKS
eukprot:8991022-Prorocentrum_lima.AAC.1